MTAPLSLEIHAGPVQRAQALEVDAGVGLPAAYGGIRRVLGALREVVPQVFAPLQQRYPAEWSKLFPGSIANAPDLSDLALSPSERRLHRESEQTFWVVNFAARALLDGLAALGRPLVVRNSGACDLNSLRCVMRAAEWSRIRPSGGTLVLADWLVERPLGAATFVDRRRAYLGTLAERMRVTAPTGPFTTLTRGLEAPVDGEGRYLAATLDEQASAESRLAAAILAIRSTFFSTNYEGAFLAAETGLALLDRSGNRIDEGALRSAWDTLDDTKLVSPAIEIDAASLGNAGVLRTLFLRSLGVVNVFTGRHDEALQSFARGIEASPTPEGKGHLHMFRALMLIKRLASLGDARKEIDLGLEWLSKAGEDRALHEGWLRNVAALVHFQKKELEAAVKEEKLAIKCVAELHSPSATHLKINLISNLSVVQETAKQHDDAITTWRRFEKISANWGANFSKHHSYRLGGLTLVSGRASEALGHYGVAYQSAEALGDTLHRQVISQELGRQALDDGRRDEAVSWFEKSAGHANDLGDPLKVAESQVGLGLAKGEKNFANAVALAEASSAYPKEAEALRAVLASGDVAAVQKQLPKPRTKLNRPFDQVNL